MNRFESIYYWKGNKQCAVLGLLQRLPNALVHCSLAQEVAQLEIVVTILESSRIHKAKSTQGIVVQECGHLGYSRVEMEVQEEEHVAFSIHWNSLMWK